MMCSRRTFHTPQTKRIEAATTAARNTQACVRSAWAGPKTFRHSKPMLPTLPKKSRTSLHTGAMRQTREEGISLHTHILNGSPARPTHTSTTKIRLSAALPFIAVHSHVHLTEDRVVLSPAVGHSLAAQMPPSHWTHCTQSVAAVPRIAVAWLDNTPPLACASEPIES